MSDLIRPLSREDIRFAQEIREIAGWNQTAKDWERLLNCEPDGCFLIESNGSPAGTATTTIHGGEVGWIGMVLVHPEFRRRGLATRLLKHCIDYLTPRTRCIKLDATPAGNTVYEKLGFVDEAPFARWERNSPPSASEVAPRNDSLDEDWIRNLDRQAFGTDRFPFLHRLAQDSESVLLDQPNGFALLRSGTHASYLGPVVGNSEDKLVDMIRSCLAHATSERVLWDIPEGNHRAVKLATALGFTRQRTLLRMRLGESGFDGDLSLQWAIGGPETG